MQQEAQQLKLTGNVLLSVCIVELAMTRLCMSASILLVAGAQNVLARLAVTSLRMSGPFLLHVDASCMLAVTSTTAEGNAKETSWSSPVTAP